MDGPMPSSLVETLDTLEDPRVDRTKLHQLTDILVLSVLAVICGADSFVAIALFGQRNEAWLRTFLELPHGIPSHDTLGRVFARLDATGFEEGFRDWVQGAFELTDGQVVPIDGKSVRGSHDRGRGLGPLHLVSAWAQANRLVLAPTAVDDKSNASTAIPELLRMLCLAGCIVTLDRVPSGWGCQKAIARQIRKQEADYVLRVRAHHQGLHDRLQDTFSLERAGDFAGCPHDYADTVEKGHGRIETRRGWTTGDPALLAHVDPDREWCDLASWVWVESERRGGDRVTTDVRIFISSLPPKARLQLQAVRQHWRGPSGCENAHHWVLDVALGEDDSRIRTGPAAHNMAILKRIAHNLLRQDRSLKVGIANKRLAAAWDKDYLCRLLGLKPKPI